MIRCIAIDDEPLALKQITGYIEKTPFLETINSFHNAFDAIEFLQQENIDLMFVDINMPDLNGLDMVKSLNNPPRIIFTTAYSEYALEGFKVDAIDYLLKPISYPDFLKSANKAKQWFEVQQQKSDKVKTDSEFLLIKSEHKIVRVNLSEIKYIESMREYVRIHLINQKPIMTLVSMKKMEASLPSEPFMRVHRSYIVNLNRVSTIERMRIIFDEKVFIPVSEQYKEQFQRYIEQNFLL